MKVIISADLSMNDRNFADKIEELWLRMDELQQQSGHNPESEKSALSLRSLKDYIEDLQNWGQKN